MEKEKKGLFERLQEFWKEKIGMNETDSIGFWYDRENVENHFAEMGAVDALSREETKKTFWEEKEVQEEQKPDFFTEIEEESIEIPEEKTENAGFFTAEVFREEWQAETEEGMGRTFLWEMPAEEKEKRSIVPVTAETVQGTEKIAEEAEKMPERETAKREERQAVPAVDIDSLMRQMTKKLWEEREGCGRRLR